MSASRRIGDRRRGVSSGLTSPFCNAILAPLVRNVPLGSDWLSIPRTARIVKNRDQVRARFSFRCSAADVNSEPGQPPALAGTSLMDTVACLRADDVELADTPVPYSPVGCANRACPDAAFPGAPAHANVPNCTFNFLCGNPQETFPGWRNTWRALTREVLWGPAVRWSGVGRR